MTGREHYQQAMFYLHEVENMERELGHDMYESQVALVLNANMMRILKKAEIHMIAAGTRK